MSLLLEKLRWVEESYTPIESSSVGSGDMDNEIPNQVYNTQLSYNNGDLGLK